MSKELKPVKEYANFTIVFMFDEEKNYIGAGKVNGLSLTMIDDSKETYPMREFPKGTASVFGVDMTDARAVNTRLLLSADSDELSFIGVGDKGRLDLIVWQINSDNGPGFLGECHTGRLLHLDPQVGIGVICDAYNYLIEIHRG